MTGRVELIETANIAEMFVLFSMTGKSAVVQTQACSRDRMLACPGRFVLYFGLKAEFLSAHTGLIHQAAFFFGENSNATAVGGACGGAGGDRDS